MRTRSLVLFATLATACLGCAGDGTSAHDVDVPTAELYGLWLTTDEDGIERVWSFAAKDDFAPAAAGHANVSSICIAGETVQTSAFEVAEGHIVETVLDDRAHENVGERFGTEILGYTGDTLVMESRTAASGRRTWTRVRRYEPRALSGWSLASVGAVGSGFRPISSTSIAFDSDGDWHLVASEALRVPSFPGSGPIPPPEGYYASRKHACMTRTRLRAAYDGGAVVFDDGRLVLPGNRVDDTVGIESHAVDDNHAPLLPWDSEPLDGLASIVQDTTTVLPDGTLRFVRGDINGVFTLWSRPRGGAWSSVPLPTRPASRVVYDRAGRAAFITYQTWDADLLLWREQANGTFVSEPVTGTSSTDGWNGPADLAAAPDGTIHVIAIHRGIEVFAKGDGGWASTRLTHHRTEVRTAIDDAGVHHFLMLVEGHAAYLRWDGTSIVRELPALPIGHAELGEVVVARDGEVALVLGGGQAALRPPDAASRRETATLTIAIEGEGEVAIEGVGTCSQTCTLDGIPVGTFASFATTPADGYVYVGLRDTEGPRPAVEPTDDGGLFPIETDAVTMQVVFRRSNVLRVVGLEPLALEQVDAAADGRAAVFATLTEPTTLAGAALPAGGFIGVLDADGAWTFARALPAELPRARPTLMSDGGVALSASFSATIDLGTGPLTQSTNLGPDLVIARFAPDGRTVFARVLPYGAAATASARRGDGLVVALAGAPPREMDGVTLPAGNLVMAFDASGRVVAAGPLETAAVALAVAPDGGVYAIGHASPESPDDLPTLAAFDSGLAPRWSRRLGGEPLTALAIDGDGNAHVYGQSRGGDYGGGEMPDPKASWATMGAVYVVLDRDGGFVSARGLVSHEDVHAAGVDGDGLVLVTPGAQVWKLGPSPEADLTASLAAPQAAVPTGSLRIIGAAWLRDRCRVYLDQRGFQDWTIEAGERTGGVIVDGRF